MNSLRLDFNLCESTTVEQFWQAVYAWLSKPSPLYSQSRQAFIEEHKELSTFKLYTNGRPGTLVSIDVRHDLAHKELTVEIIDQREKIVTNYNLCFSYYSHPTFSYEELVSSKYGIEEDEKLKIPKFLKFVNPLIDGSNLLISVLAVVDENGHFDRNIMKLERRYSKLAKVYSVNEEDIASFNLNNQFVLPGTTLILKNGDYCAAFKPENISRLDWYILKRTNRRWRNKQRFCKNSAIS